MGRFSSTISYKYRIFLQHPNAAVMSHNYASASADRPGDDLRLHPALDLVETCR